MTIGTSHLWVVSRAKPEPGPGRASVQRVPEPAEDHPQVEQHAQPHQPIRRSVRPK